MSGILQRVSKSVLNFFGRKTKKVSPISEPTNFRREGGISITRQKSHSVLKSLKFPQPPSAKNNSKSKSKEISRASSNLVTEPSSSGSSKGSLSLSSSSGSSSYSGSIPDFSQRSSGSLSRVKSKSKSKTKLRRLPLTPRELSALQKRTPLLTHKSTNKSVPIRRKLPLTPRELSKLKNRKPFSKRKLPETPKKGLRRTGAFKGYPNPYGI